MTEGYQLNSNIKEKEKNESFTSLVLACAAVYFISYLTRLNYSAVMVDIIESEGYAKSAAGAPVTALFISYGAGQIISGILGDKINPKNLITVGLAVAAAMNLAVPFCRSAAYITVAWCINGFAQALMWPPIVRIFSEYLTPKRYKTATVEVSWGGSVGTIAIYLLSPVLVTLFGWKSVFYIVAALAAVAAFLWHRGINSVEKRLTPVLPQSFGRGGGASSFEQRKSLGKGTLIMLIMIMLAIILQGIIRDGVTTWLPTYISDSFDLESAVSILTGVGMPVFSIVFCKLAELLSRRIFPNEVMCAAFFFLLCLICLGVMILSGGGSMAVSLVCLTLATGCMHGANVMLICMLPPYFLKTGHVSLVSGVLNCCTYVGSALSIYGVALVTESKGWGASIKLFAFSALVGLVILLFSAAPWRKFVSQKVR